MNTALRVRYVFTKLQPVSYMLRCKKIVFWARLTSISTYTAEKEGGGVSDGEAYLKRAIFHLRCIEQILERVIKEPEVYLKSTTW